MTGEVIVCGRNTGVGATRNTGWKRATGEWIQFLDADDLLAPRKIELQASYATRSPGDTAVVYSRWQRIGLVDGRWRPTGPLVSPSVDEDTVVGILKDADFGYVGPTLIRKSCLHAVGGFDEHLRLGEDLDLMLRIAMAGGRFRGVPSEDALFFYRQTPAPCGSNRSGEARRSGAWRACSGGSRRFSASRARMGRPRRRAVPSGGDTRGGSTCCSSTIERPSSRR
jgi:glycosyltransferase involved in cell wall biosynthesis